MVRASCCDKSGMKKGTWTQEEDMKLSAYVTKYGIWNWHLLSKYAGLPRCGKSCRLRWMNYLRPNLKRGDYTIEEDELIIKLHESLGNRWSTIASHLPGRTDNEIKNHWHTVLNRMKDSKQAAKATSSKGSSKSHSKHLRKNQKKKMPMEIDDDDDDVIIPTVQKIVEASEFSLLQQSSISWSTKSSLQPSISEVSTTFITTDAISTQFSSGSFWTEPFLTDNYYSDINYPHSSPVSIDELFSSFDFCNEHATIW